MVVDVASAASVCCQMIWDACVCELSEDLAHLFSMLSRLALMVQATGLDGHFFNFSSFDDGGVPAKVVIGRGDVA